MSLKFTLLDKEVGFSTFIMEIPIKGSILKINLMDLGTMSGIMEISIPDSFRMELEKAKGNGLEIMDRFTKASIKEMSDRELEFINGLMDNNMKDSSKVI